MKKPTLAQLKRRPALWVMIMGTLYVEPRITMPNGTIWAFNGYLEWVLFQPEGWHEYVLDTHEFGGWL